MANNPITKEQFLMLQKMELISPKVTYEDTVNGQVDFMSKEDEDPIKTGAYNLPDFYSVQPTVSADITNNATNEFNSSFNTYNDKVKSSSDFLSPLKTKPISFDKPNSINYNSNYKDKTNRIDGEVYGEDLSTGTYPELADPVVDETKQTEQQRIKENSILTDKERSNKLYGDLFGKNTTVNKEEAKKQPSFWDSLGSNPMLGQGLSLQDKLFLTGKSIGFDPATIPEKYRGKAKTTNTLTGIAAGTASGLNIVRDVMSGVGYEKRYSAGLEDYFKKQAELSKSKYQYMEGGKFELFKDGGSFNILDAPVEKVLTNEFIYALPEILEDNGNAEIEADEYIRTASGLVQKAVGATHEKGGIKVQFTEDVNIISDNLKIGAKKAIDLSKKYDINAKANDTFASTIDKYTKRIGLLKKNEELEGLYKQLEKTSELKDEATKKLNLSFLQEEIAELEEERMPLLEQRLAFTDYVYDKQEKSKGTPKYENGGSFKTSSFKAMCKKHGLSEEEGMQLLKQYEDGGNTQQQFPEEVLTLVQQYAALIQKDPNEVLSALQKINPKELQQVIEKMTTFVSQNQEQESTQENNTENGEEDAPQMKKGGVIKYADGGKYKTKTEFDNAKLDPNSNIDPDITWDEYSKWSKLTWKGYKDKMANKDYTVPIEVQNMNPADFYSTKGVYKTLANLADKSGVDSDKGDPADGYFGARHYELLNVLKSNSSEKTTTTTSEQEKVQESVFEPLNRTEQTAVTGLNINNNTKRAGYMITPQAFNLPPEALFPMAKRDFRTEYIDPMGISPDAQLEELNRVADFQNKSLNYLPASMRGAANANNTALLMENSNKAISGTNTFNAQNKQQTEQQNVSLANAEEMARYNEVPRYEESQLIALEKTLNDFHNYFNTGVKNELEKYQFKNNANVMSSMFDNVTYDMFGNPVVDPNTVPKFMDNVSAKFLDANRYDGYDEQTKAKLKAFDEKQRLERSNALVIIEAENKKVSG